MKSFDAVKTIFSPSINSILILSFIAIFIKLQLISLFFCRYKSFILFISVSYKPNDEIESKLKYTNDNNVSIISIVKLLWILKKLYLSYFISKIIPQIKKLSSLNLQDIPLTISYS